MELTIYPRKIFIKRKLCYKRISMKRTLPSWTYCEWIKKMETNFLIITVVTIVGMSIPIVICCLFFTICDPSISRVGKVSIFLFEFKVYYHYSEKRVQLRMICKTNWYFLKKEDFMVKGHTSLRDKLQLKLPFHRNGGLGGPCAHCKLIDSGDVALYGVTCPQCGEIPPSRRHRYPQLSNGHVRFDLSNSACILY